MMAGTSKTTHFTSILQLTIVFNIILSYQASHIQSVKHRIRNELALDLDLPSPRLFRRSRQIETFNTPHRGPRKRVGDYFSSWSSWTTCDALCKQKRERMCTRRKRCGQTKHFEERVCPKTFCSTSEPNFHPIEKQQSNQDTASTSAIKSSQTINVVNYADRDHDRDSNDGDQDYFVIKRRKNQKKKRRKPLFLDVIDRDDYNDESGQDLDEGPDDNYSSTVRKQHFKSDNRWRKAGDTEEDYDGDDDDYGGGVDPVLSIPNHQLDREQGAISETVGDEDLHNINVDDYEYDFSDETRNDSNGDELVGGIDPSILTKSVFDTRPTRRRERPLYEYPTAVTTTPKYRRVYSRWSRWSKCSSKCTTRRFKRCRLKEICGNEVLRETAYCYVEGTFCQEWIKSQIPDSSYAARSVSRNYFTTTTTTTTSTTTPAPLPPSIRRNAYHTYQTYNVPQNTQMSNSIDCDRRQTPIYAPLNHKCGIPTRNRSRQHLNNMLKIIGGKPAGKGQFPWQVAVLNKYKEVFCGGTLISPQWVLSAAHCVRRKLFVKLGVYNLNNTRDRNVQMMEIAMSIKHPEYNKRTVDNDIAMLKLPTSITPRNNIGFACLPQRFESLPVGSPCTIIGWGKMKNNDVSGTNLLHAAEVPIISTEECKNVYIDYKITKNMFCAGHKRGRIDTCAGDSGGPILCRDTSQYDLPWTIFGVTSFGDGCGKEEKFGIYTKLPNYVDWIWSVVNCNGYCIGNCKFY